MKFLFALVLSIVPMTAFAGDLPLCKGSTTVSIPAALQGTYSAPGVQIQVGADGIKQVNDGSAELTFADRAPVKGEDECISRKESLKNGTYNLNFKDVVSDARWYGYGTERVSYIVQLSAQGADFRETSGGVALLLWVIPAGGHSWGQTVPLVKQQ